LFGDVLRLDLRDAFALVLSVGALVLFLLSLLPHEVDLAADTRVMWHETGTARLQHALITRRAARGVAAELSTSEGLTPALRFVPCNRPTTKRAKRETFDAVMPEWDAYSPI
jgi:hypothetical protein